MINLFPKKRGAATLVMTLVLLVIITLLVFFSANYSLVQDKALTNLNRNNQAYEAAEAGLEFGISYLKQNNATILANPVNGYLVSYSDSNTSNVTLANNSKFTITYTNPIAYNYQLIRITSTGTSDDGSSTRVIKQDVQRGSLLSNPPNVPLQSLGSVSLSGSAQVVNLESNKTIQSGAGVNISGSARTITSSGGSTSSSMGSDIEQNNTTLANMSENDYFASVFGVTSNAVKNQIGHYYTASSNKQYSSTLNGMTGTSIWIDQTGGSAQLSGATVIGSATAPVLLIVNGNIKLSGTVVLYGMLFVTGDATVEETGNVRIIGSVAVGESDEIELKGSSQISYNSTIISNLQKSSGLIYYAKVPGSWKDF